MALIPIYDEFGNITSWEETTPTAPTTPDPAATTPSVAGPGGFTPPPNSSVAPPPKAPSIRVLSDGPLAGKTLPGDYFAGKTGTTALVQPSGEATTAPGDTGGGSGFTAGESFIWPEFDPGPAFQAPPPFSYEEFRAPSLEDAKAEPGYEFARTEGLRGLQNSAASRGVARTGGTLKDLIGWGNRFAEQNYGNVFNRAGMTYDRNRNNAADAYQTNYGISRDVFDRGYQQRKDVFQPKMRAAELTFEDLYRRWKGELDANTSIATAGAGL